MMNSRNEIFSIVPDDGSYDVIEEYNNIEEAIQRCEELLVTTGDSFFVCDEDGVALYPSIW